MWLYFDALRDDKPWVVKVKGRRAAVIVADVYYYAAGQTTPSLMLKGAPTADGALAWAFDGPPPYNVSVGGHGVVMDWNVPGDPPAFTLHLLARGELPTGPGQPITFEVSLHQDGHAVDGTALSAGSGGTVEKRFTGAFVTTVAAAAGAAAQLDAELIFAFGGQNA